MRLIPRITGLNLFNRGKLGFKDNIVEGALLRTEFSTHRERPCNVRRITLVLTAGINEH